MTDKNHSDYQNRVKALSPNSPLLKNVVSAFLCGGALCLAAELLFTFYASRGADEKTAYRLIYKLEEEGLINDELYATTYARDVAGVKLYGRNRVLFDLKHKGIEDEILSSLQFDELTELSKARKFAALANKKYAKNTNTKKMYKVTSALLRRGFDEHIAQEAARLEFVMGDPELELERLKAEAQRVKARYSKKYHGYDLTRRVALSLARKGYPYEDIKAALEEFDHEDYGND